MSDPRLHLIGQIAASLAGQWIEHRGIDIVLGSHSDAIEAEIRVELRELAGLAAQLADDVLTERAEWPDPES